MVSIQFSLRVICSTEATEAVSRKVARLTDALCIPRASVSRYWKDERCAVIEAAAVIESPSFELIREHILSISGADSVQTKSIPGDWECAFYASLEQLHSDKSIAFVVCNIF